MNILEYCNANVRDYTYIGIGSKNHFSELEKFTPEVDQILPCFLNAVPGTIRIIHFDPFFAPEHDKGFLDMYFKSKGFEKPDEYTWLTPDHRIEVLIICQQFTDNTFLSRMIDQAIRYSTKLVVQKYNGEELVPLFKKIYSQYSEQSKEYIKKNVLFDITYGSDCQCMTNMKIHAPMLDNAGDFYNFVLYDEHEILDSIGILPKMDELIKKYYTAKLSKVLNDNHVNYRRATRGESHMFPSMYYPANCEPYVIMKYLLEEIGSILQIFNKLGILTDEKKQIYNLYSANYIETELYAWYMEMTKLYK